MANDPLGVQEMVGAFLREAAVLVLVFGLLDPAIFKDKTSSLLWDSTVIIVSLMALVGGIVAERTRD